MAQHPYKSRMALLMAALAGGATIAGGVSGCGPAVNCENLCGRTLACEVTFVAPDDPDDDLIESGERTELQSCILGCEASDLATVEAGRCIDDIDTSDAATCQPLVTDCLGADVAEG